MEILLETQSTDPDFNDKGFELSDGA